MTRANNKTRPTAVSPEAFLATIAHPRRRADGLTLLDFFKTVTELKPIMWGPNIVGFGRYYYKYASGREGHHLITGFSPRKSALSIYIMPGYCDLSAELARLGKHRMSVSCLYINKLADVDMGVLEEIVRNGVDYIRANYETWDE